ncbi:MAG: ComF family protein [Opitutaceae bacterium]|nr:ComF family protein [Cytophagales bacterium]
MTCTYLLPRLELDNEETYRKLAGRVKISSAYSFLKFNKSGMVQKILHEVKYNNNPDLGFFVGQQFGNYLIKENIALPKDGLIPVPLHPQRQKERGYNQAEVIANGLAENSGLEVHTNLLSRIKESLTQTKKGRTARLDNMLECFALSTKTDLKGMHFGLVDDVITTGATLEACCLCLEKAGVGEISIFSIANA